MKEKYILRCLILVALGLIAYCFRWTFFYKFNPVYWENFYYTSQWNIPNSQRIIGDEGVYRYIGYRLVNGENPFNLDYWVPPFGKYFYGLTAKYFNNPYWTSWGWFILLLIIVWALTRNEWVLLFVATNSLIVSQVGKTMLDLPQGVMLLLMVSSLWFYNKNRSWLLVFSGISLGLFAGIKIGLFSPLLIAGGIYYLWKKKTSIKFIILFLLSIPLGYVISYFCYFVAHPNPIPWIRLHEKVLDFWRNSGASPHPLNILGYVLINKFNQSWEGIRIWMSANEWSILFPISFFLIIINWTKKTDVKTKFLLVIATGWLILNAFIDFWPRYLIPIVPILVIITVNYFKTKKSLLWLLLILNLFSLKNVLWPGPETTIREIDRSFKYQTYKELNELAGKEVNTNNWDKIKEGRVTLGKENNLWVIKNIQENIKTNEKIATIVNPIRSRGLWKDKSLKPIKDQYKAIDDLGLKATWLIQNEVNEDKELVEKIKQFNNKQELGIFLEISRNLALKSRVYFDEQRPWYDPGVVFLSAYSREDRISLIDQMMRDFKNTFGYYPKSVGAWWIDSYSLNYLENKYGIKTALIVADQRTTDNYGVWGQWWGYPYYPTKDNILVPGNSKILVIQWALRDPELAYYGEGPKISNYSLQANDYINQGLDTKYFEKLANIYFDPRNELGQITVGLETGIESVGYIDEYIKQLKWIKDNKINDLTMTEIEMKYRDKYSGNPSEINIGEWKMTTEYRQNIKLNERTDYKKNYVFADYYEKDDQSFLNRVYEEKNLIKKSWISKEILLSLLAIIIGIIITKLWPKRKWIIILFFVWAGLLLATRLRYSVIGGKKMFGFLIDNFRFLGMTSQGRIINGDLSNLVAKSMLKLNIKEIGLTGWIILGVFLTKIYEKFIKTRKNKKGN